MIGVVVKVLALTVATFVIAAALVLGSTLVTLVLIKRFWGSADLYDLILRAGGGIGPRTWK